MATRNRTHIEGDLKAAEREVERLQAELDAVPPAVVEVEGTTYGGRTVSLRQVCRNCVVTLKFDDGHQRRAPNVHFTPSEAGQLRDWLVYHYPKGAS